MRYGLPKFSDFLKPSAHDQVASAGDPFLSMRDPFLSVRDLFPFVRDLFPFVHDPFPSARDSMRLCTIRLSSIRLRTITTVRDYV